MLWNVNAHVAHSHLIIQCCYFLNRTLEFFSAQLFFGSCLFSAYVFACVCPLWHIYVFFAYFCARFIVYAALVIQCFHRCNYTIFIIIVLLPSTVNNKPKTQTHTTARYDFFAPLFNRLFSLAMPTSLLFTFVWNKSYWMWPAFNWIVV